jgi:preprotein translocase subunit SecG
MDRATIELVLLAVAVLCVVVMIVRRKGKAAGR